MKKLFLIFIGLSSLILADFTKNGDIVTDNITTLQWQDNNEANTTKESWINAIDYCENLSLAGLDDWRMPNINELLSIADKSQHGPAMSNVFVYVAHAGHTILYWSSTTSLDNAYYKEDRAYTVNFYHGDEYDHDNKADKTELNFIRCVRGGQ